MFMLASGLSIVVISVDRFRGIVYPFSRRLSNAVGLVIIGIIWIMSILFSVPLLQFRSYTERQWADYLEIFCGEDIAKSRTYWLVMLIIVVYIPVAAVTLAYTVIIMQMEKYENLVRNREHPSKAKNRRKVGTKKQIFLWFQKQLLTTKIILFSTGIKDAIYHSDGAFLQLDAI